MTMEDESCNLMTQISARPCSTQRQYTKLQRCKHLCTSMILTRKTWRIQESIINEIMWQASGVGMKDFDVSQHKNRTLARGEMFLRNALYFEHSIFQKPLLSLAQSHAHAHVHMYTHKHTHTHTHTHTQGRLNACNNGNLKFLKFEFILMHTHTHTHAHTHTVS